MRRLVWWGLMAILLLMDVSDVHAIDEDGLSIDLSEYQGDYMITESFKFDESLVPSKEIVALSDEELLGVVEHIFEETVAEAEESFLWHEEDLGMTNFFLLTVKEDYIVERNVMLPAEVYMTEATHEKQADASNNRVLQFHQLKSYLFYDHDAGYRSFFMFDEEGNIYTISLTSYGIAKYVPSDQGAMTADLTIPPIELPTAENRTLAQYEVEADDFESVSYDDILADSARKKFSLISLSGIVLDYVTYLDYAEARIATHDNGTDNIVLLQFHYFPLEPLTIGGQVQAHGLYVGPNNAVRWDEAYPAMMVQMIETK